MEKILMRNKTKELGNWIFLFPIFLIFWLYEFLKYSRANDLQMEWERWKQKQLDNPNNKIKFFNKDFSRYETYRCD